MYKSTTPEYITVQHLQGHSRCQNLYFWDFWEHLAEFEDVFLSGHFFFYFHWSEESERKSSSRCCYEPSTRINSKVIVEDVFNASVWTDPIK